MHADTPLLTTLTGAFIAAFLLGGVALRFKLPPLLGYLLAGILIGPFTPGFVANTGIANELAEIGIILLMFGVGLHFSIQDLLQVKKIALPGAILQIAFAIGLTQLFTQFIGLSFTEGLILGMSLSVASTVVLLKALEDVGHMETEGGKIAIGWLVTEDIATILALVLLPLLATQTDSHANTQPLWLVLVMTLVKVSMFIAVMTLVGKRIIPWMLERIVHTGSREMFRLGVLSVALGVAYAASALFDVSFALGAFLAGSVLAGSPFSQRAASEAMPLRDAFSVLFFVAAGMMFDPKILQEHTLSVIAVVFIVVIGKGAAAWAIMALYKRSNQEKWLLAASLGQIGEFSFILANLGLLLGLISQSSHGLIMAAAIISIFINPFIFSFLKNKLTINPLLTHSTP
ncbi:cation:proton antiporter [Leeia sp. TBRC 13508]|uniref:Cation:proton antiporter n=1 Tax=Leeia speluncae TaxID=2884804 RepID=A0ABS8D8E0_9NEIS|nr:cation:proton antiporter [Leeia speluncae]MCB6184478.1 cation:proton antiporter [Leeia speluncae]